VSAPAEFVDACLQREGSWERAEEAKIRLGGGLEFYGASVGAVRGTIRDMGRRHRGLTRDEITALSSELWAVPVFERRLAAVVLLQSNVPLLDNSDLTRIEGFLRSAGLRELVDPLAVDVVGPLAAGLDAQAKARADVVLDRWGTDPDAWLRRAAVMAPLRSLRAGGDDDAFIRRARMALAVGREAEDDGGLVREAVSFVMAEVAKKRPGQASPSENALLHH
jgi:DNA alkylation repair enzyme